MSVYGQNIFLIETVFFSLVLLNDVNHILAQLVLDICIYSTALNRIYPVGWHWCLF